MSALPRGTCPVCGQDAALRQGGVLREHYVFRSQLEQEPDKPLGRVRACEGSGKPPTGGAPIPPAPAVGDPVVVDGTKYRIRALGRLAACRESFGGRETRVDPAHLVWDRVAAVWRPEGMGL